MQPLFFLVFFVSLCYSETNLIELRMITMKNAAKYLITTIIICMLFCGCSVESPARIAATTMPVACFTQRLCEGTGITVTQLVTEEVSCLHDYTLTVSQMKAIEGARMVILSGAGLEEEFMEDALERAGDVVDASAGIELLEGACHHQHEDEEDAHGHEEGHSHESDPHIWLDPDNAAVMAKNIFYGLSERWPEHKEQFEANLVSLLEEIQAVSAYADNRLSSLSNREIITFHDGFGYLAHAFDLEILEAIEEESGSEPSAQELIGLIELVEHHGVAAIFVEANGSSSAASVISRETGVPVYTLSMAMSGGDWFDCMYHNIDVLKEALK